MMEGTEADLPALEMDSDNNEEEEEGKGPRDGQWLSLTPLGNAQCVLVGGSKPSFMKEPSEQDVKLADKAKQYGKMVCRSRSASSSPFQFFVHAHCRRSQRMAVTVKVGTARVLTWTGHHLHVVRGLLCLGTQLYSLILYAGEGASSNGDALGENQDPAQAGSAVRMFCVDGDARCALFRLCYLQNTGRPRPLHLTHSVYIRHIPPKISSEDIVKVGSASAGTIPVIDTWQPCRCARLT